MGEREGKTKKPGEGKTRRFDAISSRVSSLPFSLSPPLLLLRREERLHITCVQSGSPFANRKCPLGLARGRVRHQSLPGNIGQILNRQHTIVEAVVLQPVDQLGNRACFHLLGRATNCIRRCNRRASRTNRPPPADRADPPESAKPCWPTRDSAPSQHAERSICVFQFGFCSGSPSAFTNGSNIPT